MEVKQCYKVTLTGKDLSSYIRSILIKEIESDIPKIEGLSPIFEAITIVAEEPWFVKTRILFTSHSVNSQIVKEYAVDIRLTADVLMRYIINDVLTKKKVNIHGPDFNIKIEETNASKGEVDVTNKTFLSIDFSINHDSSMDYQ